LLFRLLSIKRESYKRNDNNIELNKQSFHDIVGARSTGGRCVSVTYRCRLLLCRKASPITTNLDRPPRFHALPFFLPLGQGAGNIPDDFVQVYDVESSRCDPLLSQIQEATSHRQTVNTKESNQDDERHEAVLA
jgi:hypothetical protein